MTSRLRGFMTLLAAAATAVGVTLVPAAAQEVGGGVEGRVVSAADGAGVEGAVVAVDSLGRRTTTLPGGAFRLVGLPEGRWSLRVEAEGYRERTVLVRVPGSGVVVLDVELTPAPGPDVRGRAPGSLRGRVLEEDQLRPVPQAEVVLVEPGLRAWAGPEGEFLIPDVPPGSWTLRVSAPGYRVVERPVRMPAGAPPEDGGLEVLLETSPLAITGVHVLRHRLRDVLEMEAPGARLIDSTLVDLAPETVERDVFRAAQTLPSVTPATDFSTALYVRGGTPDQTRIFLDGAPLHNPFHLGGFVSAFAPAAVAGSVLRPGGLSADIPSSLSGTFHVHTVDGARDSLRVNGMVGLLSSSLTADGPLPADRGTFMVSARRTYLDLATGLAAGLGLLGRSFPYGFTDALARASLDAGSRTTVTVLAYMDLEGFDDPADGPYEAVQDVGWRSDALSLRASTLLGDRVRAEGGVATSGFRLAAWRERNKLTGPDPVLTADTVAAEVGLRTVALDGTLTAALGTHTLSAGIRWEHHGARHAIGEGSLGDDLVPALDVDGVYGALGIFVRDRWKLDTGWWLDAGLRGERPRGRSWELLPRGRLEKRLTGGLTLGVAGGRYVQDWWSLRNEESAYTGVVSYDLTAPVPADMPLPRGWDLMVDARIELAGWMFRADVFRKSMEDLPTAAPLVDAADGLIILRPADVTVGGADVRGLELSATGRLGASSVAVAYRWQEEERTLGDVSFTPRTDRRHRLVAQGTHPFGEREVAVAITWQSGIPFTAAGWVLPGPVDVGTDGRPTRARNPGRGRVVMDGINGERLPAYLRLDLSARGGWEMSAFGRKGVLEPYLSVLNVLNRANGFTTAFHVDGGQVIRTVGPQLPVLPSVGVRWRF